MSDHDAIPVASLSGGANQERVRVHNERLVLSLVRRHDGLSKADIARRTGLSAQTVTMIMRALERDGLLLRGPPTRGRVGQPSTPMSLNPAGAFSFGLKIGRRSVDLVLMDFTGRIRGRRRQIHAIPRPAQIVAFARDGVAALIHDHPEADPARIGGLGVAMPFELWNWADTLGVARDQMQDWKETDIQLSLREATGLPVLVQNDCSAACGAELMFGQGRRAANYAYFFIGYFIGGGVVLENVLHTGPSGNAGGFGTLRVSTGTGAPVPLLECASLHILEDRIAQAGGRPSDLWDSPEDWSRLGPVIDRWITQTAEHLAQAILSTCSVLDFEAVIIDGNLPGDVRERLVAATAQTLAVQDMQGINPFELAPGTLGHNAQVLGGASLPLMARYLVDNSVLFKAPV